MKILIQRKGWAEWELGHNLSEIAPRNDNLWQADSLMTTLYGSNLDVHQQMNG